MTIQRAREVLGDKYIKRTDEEIRDIISFLERLVNISIDTVLAMTPEERKVIKKT
jgi:hypothetical protein